MFSKVCLLLLLVAECKCSLFCDFKKNLCSWTNAYECQFKHETKIPLARKTGYLEISKNTCNVAAIVNSVKPIQTRFRFNYIFNGTGRANIYVYGIYITGRSIVWQCDNNQGPKWNAVEIYIKDSFFWNIKGVIIEVNTIDDVTVAIGNIESPKSERLEFRCPPSPPIIKKTTKKSITTKKITKRPRPTIPSDKNHTICSFTLHLCKWRDLNHRCHFKHVKDTPFLGETGYLMLSKDTCKQASLMIRLKEYEFQLHYLMNGTGDMSLSVGVVYGFFGHVPMWSCSTSQGPEWHKVDMKVRLIHFDPRISVIIKAEVKGDATIAIGNIGEAGHGVMEKKCPSRSPISTTPRILPEFSSTHQEFASSSSSRSRSSSHSSVSLSTPQLTSVRNNVETKSESKPITPTTNTESITDHRDQKVATSKLVRTVTAQNYPKSSLTTVLRQLANAQVESRSNKGSIIGGSVMAAIVVVAVTVFSIFIYKRKIRVWKIQRSTRQKIEEPYKVFQNQS